MTSPALDPILMRFVDPAVERHYGDDRRRFRLSAVRVAAIAMAGVWLAFIVLNAVEIHDPSQALLNLRVSGLVVNIAFFGVTFFARPGRWIDPLGFIVIVVVVVQNMMLREFMSPVSLPYI